MPARTDHDRRDAQHAARATIAIAMGRYVRRLTEEAYSYVELELTDYDGTDPLDWSAVGAASANRALASYGVISSPERAIDGDTVAALDAGDDPEAYAAHA